MLAPRAPRPAFGQARALTPLPPAPRAPAHLTAYEAACELDAAWIAATRAGTDDDYASAYEALSRHTR